jgi:Uma2 family endonuclease
MTLAQPHLLTQPEPRRWTREEYLRTSEAGVFDGRPRVERFDWQIVEMPAQNNPHATAVPKCFLAAHRVFGGTHSVRVAATLAVGPSSDPEPDVAVVEWAVQQRCDPPDAAVLVIEVSDTTLRYDLGAKANLYASVRLSDYWVVDVRGRQVYVHRNPIPDPAARFGHRYTAVSTIPESGSITPLVAAHAQISVKDLLP